MAQLSANAPISLGGLPGAEALALLTSFALEPQGRLCLATAAPTPTASVLAAATVYYTPYKGALVPVYDGTRFVARVFTELSNVLANSATGSAGPAAAIAASNYDLFVWSNSGTLTLTRGPLWTSDTGRGSGAGTTQLTMVNGIYTNTVAITNGPGAGLGTYVGTVRTDAGGATVSFDLGSLATDGTQGALIGVWNAYNRIDCGPVVSESQATWTYTSATLQASNADAANCIAMIRGLDEDAIIATFSERFTTAAVLNALCTLTIGLDSTSARAANASAAYMQNPVAGAAYNNTLTCDYAGWPGLGFHTLQSIEASDGTNAMTFYGGTYYKFRALMRY